MVRPKEKTIPRTATSRRAGISCVSVELGLARRLDLRAEIWRMATIEQYIALINAHVANCGGGVGLLVVLLVKLYATLP